MDEPAPAAWALAGPAEIAVALRRRRRRLIRARLRRPAAVAAALGLIAAGRLSAPPAPVPLVPVWVAATDLPAGARIDPGDLRPARWPAGLVPEDAWRGRAPGCSTVPSARERSSPRTGCVPRRPG
ncbi:MAG: SAF domain-containing protein [Kineosporiaceae bacterium]